MELNYVGMNIYKERRYECVINDKCIIYCTLMKNSEETVVDFVVGLPGGIYHMTEEEAEKYRLGIDGSIGAFTGKAVDCIYVNFSEKAADFGDFYTEEGTLIKKMLVYNKKHHMFDGTAYYEVTSDAEYPSAISTETFISKDDAHKCTLSPDLISEKEKYEKLFLEIFEKLR